MTRTKAITLLCLLFLAGALAGSFIGYNIGQRTNLTKVAPVQKPDHGSRRPHRDVRSRLSEDLKLTEEQLTQIDPILTDFNKQLEAMSKKSWDDLWLAISNRDERIKPYLTEEQLALLKERQSRRFQPGESRGDKFRRDKSKH
jgi:predicted transglutaminase-like cysteine proteinase